MTDIKADNTTSTLLTKEIASDLEELCEKLLQADPQIRDIVLFGSFAYAPDLALDVDLLVTTLAPKDYDVYLDAAGDWPLNVDVVVRQPGAPIGDRISWSVRAFGAAIYGNSETIEEVRDTMPPTYEGARTLLLNADEILDSAKHEENEVRKEDKYRTAYDKLFDVARNAVMAFLNTEQTRWGQLRRALPQPVQDRFRQMIDTLHVSYSYGGNYPQDRPEEEFQRWRQEVEQFIDDLENFQP